MSKHDFQFELSGTRFRGNALDPEQSLDGFAKLSPLLGPILDKLQPGGDKMQQLAELLTSAVGSFSGLPQFRPIFLPQYTVRTGGKELPLEDFDAQVFKGKPALQVGWLVGAICNEYRDFLAESGMNTFLDLANSFGFQITSAGTGSSGGS